MKIFYAEFSPVRHAGDAGSCTGDLALVACGSEFECAVENLRFGVA